MPSRFFFLVMLMVCSYSSRAQVQISIASRIIPLDSAGILYRFSSELPAVEGGLESALCDQWRMLDAQVKISYQPDVLWLKIGLKTVSSQGPFEVVYINNPAINKLWAWIVRENGDKKYFPVTGDHLMFNSRQHFVPGFAYSVNSLGSSEDTLVLALEKRSSKLDVPLEFFMIRDFQGTVHNQLLGYGLAIGVLLLLIFLNFLLYASSTQRLYLYYSVYLISILVYVGSDGGILFQFVYPDMPFLNDLIRPFSFAFSLLPMMMFFNSLVDVKKYSPGINRFNKFMAAFYATIFVVALVSSAVGDFRVQEKWLNVNSVLGPFILMIVLSEAFYFSWKRRRFAGFALVSFSSFFVLIIVFSLAQNGILATNWFTLNAQYIAMVVDIVVVAFSLIWRFKTFSEDSVRLQAEYVLQQRTIFEESAAWQKSEMQRVSSFLHDNIGADLGLLRLKVDKMPLNEDGRKELASMISSIGANVRQISHQSSPLQLQSKGLYTSVEDMIRSIRKDSGIDIQFEWLGERDHLGAQYETVVYRVLQELLQNILKHSQATEAIVQVMNERTVFGIYVEDNGVGAEFWDQRKNSIGLKNIEHLIKNMKGHFSVDTQQGKGFSVSIEFPLNF